MKRAQGSLEYLIIIAAVIAVAAIAVLFLSGSFGSTRDVADIANCKEAASRCAVERATSISPACAYCETDCPEELVDECMAGEPQSITVLECENDGECDDSSECTVDSCSEGYCANVEVANETSCSDGTCCGGTCAAIACSSDAGCDDGFACSVDKCVNPGVCGAECDHSTTITSCVSGDGCCPAGCSAKNDLDCPIVRIMGWAAGYGAILSTDDGVNWEANLSVSGQHFRSVDFVNFTHGNAITISGRLYYTVDGGVTWSLYNIGTYMTAVNIFSTDLLTPDLGFVGCGRLSGAYEYGCVYKTNLSYANDVRCFDRGEIWKVFIVDSTNAWAVGYNSSADGTAFNSTITWINPASMAYSLKYVSSGFHRAVFFQNSTAGVVGGDYGVLRTTDAGATWQKLTSSAVSDIYFINASHGWASPYGAGYVLKTTDYGATWSQAGGYLSYAGSIYFLNATHGWVATDDNASPGSIYKTTDGGATWERLPDVPAPDALHDMTFFYE